MQKRIFYKQNINKDYIISLLRDALNADEGVVFAYLYGSFIEADNFFCDIDIAVYSKSGENQHALSVQIKEHLADMFSMRELADFAADDFDVRIINEAAYDFVINIIDKGLLIVSKDEEIRTSYIEHICTEYRLNQIVLDEALR